MTYLESCYVSTTYARSKLATRIFHSHYATGNEFICSIVVNLEDFNHQLQKVSVVIGSNAWGRLCKRLQINWCLKLNKWKHLKDILTDCDWRRVLVSNLLLITWSENCWNVLGSNFLITWRVALELIISFSKLQ